MIPDRRVTWCKSCGQGLPRCEMSPPLLSPSPSPQKREELFLLQEALRRKRARLQAESPEEEKGLQELTEEIEVLAANIDYINDSITDCQATIMHLEKTKVSAGQSICVGGSSEWAWQHCMMGVSTLLVSKRRSWTQQIHQWSYILLTS